MKSSGVAEGGMISTAGELGGHGDAWIWRKVDAIGATLDEVFALAKKRGLTTADAADRIAEDRIAAIEAGLSEAA